MKTSRFVVCLGAVTGLGLIQSQGIEPLRLLKTIPIPSIEKRIDHLSVDLKGNRIFLAALGNNTVEVLLLSEGGPAKSLKGFQEPQGLAYVPEFNQLFVASGGDGTCKIFEADTFRLVNTLQLAG